MATIKFLQQSDKENAPIYVYLSAGWGKFFKTKTREILNPKYWNGKRGEPKSLKAIPQEQAQKIERIRDILHHLKSFLFSQYTSRGTAEINALWIKNKVEEFYEGKKINDLNKMENLIYFYLTEILPHEKNKGRFLRLDTIRNKKHFAGRFLDYLKQEKGTAKVKDIDAKKINDFVAYMQEQGYFKNTIGENIIFIKQMLRIAKNKGIETAHDWESVKRLRETTPTPFLFIEELEKIKNTDYKEPLHHWRNWLIIGCYTGQRASDILRMNKEKIKQRNGKTFIELIQEKTGQSVAIPLHKQVKEILKQYNNDFPPLPYQDYKCNLGAFNIAIKKILNIAGINRPHEGRKPLKGTKKAIKGIFPLCDIASSHICRRTFASNHYGKVPTPVIMSITGHKEEKTFLNYIGVDDSTLSSMILDYWEK